jgi:hypothetical protein
MQHKIFCNSGFHGSVVWQAFLKTAVNDILSSLSSYFLPHRYPKH